MQKKSLNGTCVFCGVPDTLTEDHIPPQSIFPKPRENDLGLIYVPACEQCNNGSAVDDEEFKLFVALKAGRISVSQRKLHDHTRRTVSHNNRLRDRLLKATRLFLPSNARSGFTECSLLSPPIAPIRRVLRKLVLGLYFHHHSNVICNDVRTYIILDDEVKADKAEEFGKFCGEIVEFGTCGAIGSDREFRYWYGTAAENPLASAWVFRFYERLVVLGLTMPNDEPSI